MHDDTLAFTEHDHRTCIRDGLAEAEQLAAARGSRFTPIRRRVLEILLESHVAMGAYDVLERLKDEGLGTHPPVAYRALEFLLEQGFAHRIERLNAFVGCMHIGAGHDPAFLICRTCRKVAEAPAGPLKAALADSAEATDFDIERVVVEAVGLCPGCRPDPAT